LNHSKLAEEETTTSSMNVVQSKQDELVEYTQNFGRTTSSFKTIWFDIISSERGWIDSVDTRFK